MKLVIAEKEEVALAIGRAVCGVDAKRTPVSGNGYTVAAASGHLLELVEPQSYDARLAYAGGDWTVDDLPIIFRDWKRAVKRGRDAKNRKTGEPDARAKARLDKIEQLVREADVVVNAGDPDDEGQCIVDEILEHIGYTGQVQRVYVNDTIEKNIRREFARAVPNAMPWRDGQVAYARAMADMVFGVNDTRLLAKRLGLRNVSLGRVQTPVLRMVVERDRAIEQHRERLFYEIACTLSERQGAFGPVQARVAFSKAFLESHGEGKHVFDKAVVKDAAQRIANEDPYRLAVTRKPSRKSPPLPYTITQLEAEMSAQHGYSASETLAATQVLRDKYQAITYNRTSSPYLKEEHWEEAPETLGIAMENIALDWPLDFALKAKSFDDSKVSAHHGIIPQATAVDLAGMPEREANVYRAIVVRYALQFLPDAVYDVCEGEADVFCGKLVYKARALAEPGWTAYAQDEEDSAGAEPGAALLPAGEYLCDASGMQVQEKKTAPPKRYTVKTLLLDMASASKYVRDPELRKVMREKDASEPEEHGGIGTSATRHAILDTLKKRGFIEERGKAIVSTERGRAVYDILPEGLGTVDMTARWYLVQEEIREGRADANLLAETVADEFRSRKETAYVGVTPPPALQQGRKYVGTCPRCGKRIVNMKNTLQCESNRFEKGPDGWKRVGGCGWSFFKTVAHKKLTDKQAADLLAGKQVLVKGLTNKNGEKFDSRIALTDLEAGKIAFVRGKKPARRPARKK